MGKNYITECCICRDWRDPKSEDPNIPYDPHFYTPTAEQRRAHFFSDEKFSHGYCPPCIVLQWRRDGLPESEVEDFVHEAFKQKEYRERNPR